MPPGGVHPIGYDQPALSFKIARRNAVGLPVAILVASAIYSSVSNLRQSFNGDSFGLLTKAAAPC